MSTDLTQASEAFVEALKAGLAAFDAGNRDEAYQIFDQALDIEPDNIWGLLWKGATAPAPRETAHWLEQVLALNPDNIHAEAGMAWARDQLGVVPTTEEMPVAPPAVGEPEEVEEPFVVEEPAPPPVEEAVEIPEAVEPVAEVEAPDWLRDEVSLPEEEEEKVPTWLEGPAPVAEEEPAEEVAAAEVEAPDWLREAGKEIEAVAAEEAPPAVSEEPAVAEEIEEEAAEPFALPSWLTDEIPEAPAETEGAATVIAGLEETAEVPAGDETGLPDWLEAEAAVTEEKAGAETAYEHYQQGLAYYEENRLEEAAKEFEAAAELNPDHVETHNYLGSVYFLQGKPADAVEAFHQALQRDQNHAESHLNLGLVYQETGKSAEAVKEFETYLELDPNSGIASEVKGFIEALQG